MTENEFRKRLNELAIEKNLTYDDMADACALSPITVKRWLAGTTSPHPILMNNVLWVLEKL